MYKLTTKFIFLVLAVLLTAEVAMAQVPQGFNFQAVARDSDGELIANTQLGVQISILQGAEDGTAVYTETQSPETDNTGLFNLVIGEGTSEDDFGAIDWAADNYYVKLAIDPAGGEEYEELGTTRLLSVPYALLAQDVVNGSGTSTDVDLPLTLTGDNGNLSITIGTQEGDNNFGFIGLGNADGDTLAQVYVENRGDTASRGTMMFRDTFGRYSNVIPGEFSTGHKDGGFRSHLTSNNLYFINSDLQTNAPPAWFGTLGGNGFYQLLDYSDTGIYEGGILSGFWAGYPALLMEDGNEQPGIWLANDDGGGKLVLHSPNGTGQNIQMGGKSWEDPNLPFMVFRGNEDEENTQPDLIWMEVQKWEDGTEVGNITLRGTDGSEFSINSHGIGGSNELSNQVLVGNDNGDIVAAINSHEPDKKKGFIHLYGETEPEINDLRAGLEVSDNESGDSWGHLFLKGPDGSQDMLSAYIQNDPNGNDPDGWAGRLNLWGSNSPNIIMEGKNWESADTPQLLLYGNKPNNDGWFYEHVNLAVNKDVDQEWGALSLFGNENSLNVEIGAKSWEDATEGAGRPFMVFKGNNPDEDLIWMDVVDDGTNEFGNLNFRSTDGANFSINAYGINGDADVNGNLHVNGDITYTGSSGQTSDRRLKENIQPLQNGLGTIMKLNPTTYNFRGNGEYNGLKLSTGLHYGLIAQEVEEVLPSLVKNNVHTYSEVTSTGSGPTMHSETEVTKTMEYKTLNYTELVPVLVKAVQEQQKEIEQLLEEVEQLKDQRKLIQELQKDLQELKKD